MKALITIRLTPESRNDLIHTYGAHYRAYREQIERAVAQGKLGLPPDKIQLRWLLTPGQWDAGEQVAMPEIEISPITVEPPTKDDTNG